LAYSKVEALTGCGVDHNMMLWLCGGAKLAYSEEEAFFLGKVPYREEDFLLPSEVPRTDFSCCWAHEPAAGLISLHAR